MPNLQYISVDYTTIEQDLSKKLNIEKKEEKDEEEEEEEEEKEKIIFIVEVNNIPTAQYALQLISQEKFKSIICEKEDILCINLSINEKVEENFKELPNFFEFKFKDNFIISFQSSNEGHESMTYWKIPDREKFYSTYVDDDCGKIISKFLHEFLIEELVDGDSGVISAFKDKNEIRLPEIGTASNSNLLMIAALWNNLDAVQHLVTREFDVDYRNNQEDMAIDKAWETFIRSDEDEQEDPEEIILCLLNANSVFPKAFDFNKASVKIQEFVEMCQKLHDDVKKGDMDNLENKLKEHPNLLYFYSKNNKSLFLHALENKKFKIIDYLENGLNAGAHEELDFFEGYKNQHRTELENLRLQHKLNAKVLPKTHLLVLRSKTKIGSNDQLSHVRRRSVEETFDILDNNAFCSLILQVVAHIKFIKIFFDFKHESIYYLDPMKAKTTLGTVYPNGTIYIGAKGLGDGSERNKVSSALAHELCHLAVLVSYMNPNFDPFPMGESDEKLRYIDEVMVESRDKMAGDEIVTNAFGYADELIASELIVTAAQLAIMYHDNPVRINELRGIFDELFKYAKEVVEPELERALPVLRKLGDPEINIKYDSLTDAMKKSISHMTINLQGVDTTFYELFGDDDSCLKLLTPENIRDMLLNGTGLKINEICTLDLKYSLIERNFIDRATYQKLKAMQGYKYTPNVKQKSKPILDIREQSKFFILADYAGTGKTTIFRDSAIKIKQKETTFWVSYINLRKFEWVFKKYEQKLENLSSSDVGEILLQILIIDDKKFEKEIFQNLLKRGQVVLLFDGVDEICPRHTDILMKTFAVLKQFAGTNEFWVSTRPHYAARIMEVFGVSPITFVLYTQEQKFDFIKDVLTKNKVTDETEQDNAIGQINAFIFHLNWVPGFYSDPDHPLIIEIITEIYVEKREIKLDASSHYAIYAAMIDKQKEKVGEKIPNVERDPFSSLSVWQAHQVLAILVIIGPLYDMSFQCILPDGTYYNHNFSFTLEQLSIIEKWRQERRGGRWTSDMIQRYGFVTVNLDNLMEDRSCIDFSHKTYAEFFLAQYFIDFLFNNNFDEDEMKKIMHLLHIVQGTPSLSIVSQFIFSFMKTVAKVENRKFHREIKRVFQARVEEAIGKLEKKPLIDGQDAFIFFGNIIVCDDELVAKLWGLNDEQNSLNRIILSGQLKNLELILYSANFVLGEDWHERLNRSGTKLISNDQIEAMRDKVVESWDDWKRDKDVLKFCDYMHKNLDKSIQRKIHDEKVNLSHISNNKVRIEIIKIMSDIYDKETFVDKCIKKMYFSDFSEECLEFILNEIAKLYNNDRGSIRKILFEDLRGESSLLYKAIISRTPIVLQIVKKYYLKYQDSTNEVQDILMEIETSEIFKYTIESKIYPEFKTFVKDLFKDDIDSLKEKIEDFLDDFYEAASDDNYEHIKDFIYFLFSDGDDNIKADDLLDNVGVKEPSEDEDYGCKNSDDGNSWDAIDDYDDTDYTGDIGQDIILKKIKKIGKLAAEGNDISYLFP